MVYGIVARLGVERDAGKWTPDAVRPSMTATKLNTRRTKYYTERVDRRTFLAGLAAAGASLGVPTRPRTQGQLEQRILELMDTAGLQYIGADTVAVNLDVPLHDAITALEELQHRGEVRAEAPIYERTK